MRLIYCKIDSRYKKYNQIILPKLSPIRPGDLLAVYVESLIPMYVDPKPARPLNGPHPNPNVLSCFNPSGLEYTVQSSCRVIMQSVTVCVYRHSLTPYLPALPVLLDEVRCPFRECVHSGLQIRRAYQRDSTRIYNPQSFDIIDPQIGIHHSVSLAWQHGTGPRKMPHGD